MSPVDKTAPEIAACRRCGRSDGASATDLWEGGTIAAGEVLCECGLAVYGDDREDAIAKWNEPWGPGKRPLFIARSHEAVDTDILLACQRCGQKDELVVEHHFDEREHNAGWTVNCSCGLGFWASSEKEMREGWNRSFVDVATIRELRVLEDRLEHSEDDVALAGLELTRQHELLTIYRGIVDQLIPEIEDWVYVWNEHERETGAIKDLVLLAADLTAHAQLADWQYAVMTTRTIDEHIHTPGMEWSISLAQPNIKVSVKTKASTYPLAVAQALELWKEAHGEYLQRMEL